VVQRSNSSGSSHCMIRRLDRRRLAFVRAPALGAGGLRFNSGCPDQYFQCVVDCTPQKSAFSATAALYLVGVECLQLLTRSLQFSLQSIWETTRAGAAGLLGDISEYFRRTGKSFLRSSICTGREDLSRRGAGYFTATPKKLYLYI